jgi:hypothetical protein
MKSLFKPPKPHLVSQKMQEKQTNKKKPKIHNPIFPLNFFFTPKNKVQKTIILCWVFETPPPPPPQKKKKKVCLTTKKIITFRQV